MMSDHEHSDVASVTSSDTPPHLLYNGRHASARLRFVIVGCGIGGLAAAYCLGQAGHDVTVVEAAQALSEVGAGIQMSSNMSKLLLRWGLEERLEELAVRPQTLDFCRYDTGERVGFTLFGSKLIKNHGAPYYHIHRADLLSILYENASPLMDLRLGSRVASVDPAGKSITLINGDRLSADVIIGADGIKSVIREAIHGQDLPVPTGDSAYRALVSTEQMREDPDLRSLIDTPQIHVWMGPGKHVVGYCVRKRQLYNLVMIHPDDGSSEAWNIPGSTENMKTTFHGWEPRIMKLLNMVKSVTLWKLMVRQPLSTWVHPDAPMALLGDAAHPMLPYRAQGSAMAVEDAAVLGNLFSRITSKEQIQPMLKAYESVRYARATATQTAAQSNQIVFHLPDGPAQEARDESFRSAMEDALKEAKGDVSEDDQVGNANLWADRAKNAEQFSYDADEAADAWWSQNGYTIAAQEMAQKWWAVAMKV